MKNDCKHELIAVNRRVFGWEQWNFTSGANLPFEWADDIGLSRSQPKTGKCWDCGRRVNIPYHLSDMRPDGDKEGK